jgi:hypothetical protein
VKRPRSGCATPGQNARDVSALKGRGKEAGCPRHISLHYHLIFNTIKYISGQASHHRKMSFKEEYVDFLKKSGIELDEKYLW